ncbi:MAG: hypothetical protein ACFFG0_09265 [Candidatus Thorarchaeota archaeon]
MVAPFYRINFIMARTEVILISCPVIDWNNFVNKVATSTGRIITSGIDGSGLVLKHHSTFLASLGELKSGNTIHPIEAIKIPGIKKHLNFSFLIHSKSELILGLTEFDIKLLITKAKQGKIAVATGTLEQWQGVMIAENLSEIGCQIREQFNHLGLTQAQLLT